MLIRSLAFFLYPGLTLAASFPVLTYSTYLRDNFTPNAIATDSSGNIYIAGNAIVDASIPQTAALVVKLNPQATEYVYVRYLGGSVNDYANAIAVDGTGNAYIAGSTASPDFPVTAGVSSGAPASQTNQRSFVTKLDPNGELVFSEILGAPAASSAQAVAVNSSGQVAVTGTVSNAAGPTFPSTTGAYSVAGTANHPYLIELDPTGTKTIFSATGIGGSALAVDSSGNIYVAGTTSLLDYPTTPGTYQPALPVFNTCYAPCQLEFQGQNQYVTKVDPTGSMLIYSTAVSGTGVTVNGGLAVDAAGNVYLTGYAGSSYPYTVTPPQIPGGNPLATYGLPFLSKLDPAGQTLLFSVPVGGTGVVLDTKGAVYVGGAFGAHGIEVSGTLPALATVPSQCMPNSLMINPVLIYNSAYVAQIDGSSGNLLGSQFIGGSNLRASAVALSGSTLWIAGPTSVPDFALTPNILTLPSLFSGEPPGAYLGAIDFSQPQPPAGAPQIGCVLDGADLAPIAVAARYQLVTILGTGLGPATGVNAPDNSTTSLAGVSVTIGSVPAPLLYVSSTQINLAVPLVLYNQSFATMQVTVNSLNAAPRELALTYANPSLFINTAQTFQPNSPGFVAVAVNADGSQNSSTNPAQFGSSISVFVNGLTPDPQVDSAPLQLSSDTGWSVTGVTQATPFVLRVGLQVPSKLINDFDCFYPSACSLSFALYTLNNPGAGPESISFTGQVLGGVVFVTNPLRE